MKTRIKLYLLATDTQSGGTEVSHFYNERDRWLHLIDMIEQDSAEAIALLDAEDWDGLHDWINDTKEPMFTWQSEDATIDVSKAESAD